VISSEYIFNSAVVIGYIGPGAGFAFMGSFFLLFAACCLALVSILLFPVRAVARAVKRTGRRRKPSARRVIVAGMDGLDPEMIRGMIARGDLPNIARLANDGFMGDLETTRPPISPVAWSTFATGANPGKHGIFDFLNRDLRTRVPRLSSCRITDSRGGLRGRRGSAELLRKSEPFWRTLGEHDVSSTVLRVPVTFPPERFAGRCLSAMCAPDLRGTQGSFTVFESESPSAGRATGGTRIMAHPSGGVVSASLPGPVVDGHELAVPFEVRLRGNGESAELRIQGTAVKLMPNEYSPWVRVTFGSGMRRAGGICRFLLLSTNPVFRLYVTPINIDPGNPVLPVSHPAYYSLYLSKLHGPFATLGLAEDTWALSEGVLNDAAFLRQAYDIHDERERMFFDAVERTGSGLCACVFDLPDRVQHMFYRYMDDRHCAPRDDMSLGKAAIPDAYRKMDEVVGKLMRMSDPGTALFVLSDHGFRSFRRGVHMNAWLRDHGYLALREGAGGEYFAGVDWEKTKAYAFGLSGIYLNLKGRESGGIVEPEDAGRLKAEIAAQLAAFVDARDSARPVKAAYDSQKIFTGPYGGDGPDIVVGYDDGYRASWETAVGRTDGDVLSDNTKRWSGDHCMDSGLVPGVLLGNMKPAAGSGFAMQDMAPTVLGIFDVKPPAHMDGKAIALKS